MGTFTHPITLYSKSGEASETLEALVDTDTLFAAFPRSLLERLGVHMDESRGQPIGHVEAQLGEHRLTIMCVFGEDDQPARIGRHTLDTFLLEADFEKEELVPKTFQLIQHF
jgi:hypothetical protein